MFYPMFGAFTVNIKRSVILQRIVNVLLCRLYCIGTHNSVKLLLQTECQVVQAIIRAAILVVTICLPLPSFPYCFRCFTVRTSSMLL